MPTALSEIMPSALSRNVVGNRTKPATSLCRLRKGANFVNKLHRSIDEIQETMCEKSEKGYLVFTRSHAVRLIIKGKLFPN